jgi:anaerobic selenocysteine-containing dehydrogenase
MAAAGLYTIGGSFWEFGEPDWDLTRYFMLFGVAEDHSSNPIKIGLGKLKERGVKIVSVNPVRTGYNAIADEWLAIRPGTDGVLVGALIQELLRHQRIDVDYLAKYTNAFWQVNDSPGSPEHGLFVRDDRGEPLRAAGARAGSPGGRRTTRTVLEMLAERFLAPEYTPERAERETSVSASTIRRIAAELAEAAFDRAITLDIPWTDTAGRRHDKMIGRPVSMHAMRGISAHANGFHTCRLIHLLQILLGTIDCPGGYRYKPPYPKPIPPPVKPAGKAGLVRPRTPLGGSPLGFPLGPQDLLVDHEGKPLRIDKAYSWEAPLAAHGLMHTVIGNAARRDPYGIDVLFLYMANMGWNSSMNVPATLEHLTAKDPSSGGYVIPRIIYADAYASETVAFADLVLPDTTYLERWDCISLLDRPISEPNGPADAIRQPVVNPDRNVRPFQDVLLDLGARLGLPGFVDDDGKAKYPGGYADYMINHERAPGIGPLAGWRGENGDRFGRGAVNRKQLDRYIENGCFHIHHLPVAARYFKHANKDYLEWAVSVGFLGSAEPIIFQLYSEPLQRFRLAAEGHGAIRPPSEHRRRIAAHFDPLPYWQGNDGSASTEGGEYPLHAITQRPMHMYHSWGGQNAWQRQITSENRLYVHRKTGAELGLGDDDWVWVTSATGRLKCQVRLMDGVNPQTVWTWNAIGKRSGTWALAADAPESRRGFLLNHLIADLLPGGEDGHRYSNSDPVTGQAAWYNLRVRIEKCSVEEPRELSPRFESVSYPDRNRGQEP